MEDRMVDLLRHAQKDLNIKPEVLCNGICTEEMYHMVINGKRFFDRITIKRLIARVGVDNAIYGNYLHYPDYCVWLKRTRIINAILENRSEKAEELLATYIEKDKNFTDSRANIEKQFQVFMSLQILRLKSRNEYDKDAKEKYLEALKYTVPNVEDVAGGKVILSPAELCMYIEYLRRTNISGLEYVWDMYVDLLLYVDKSHYGNLAKLKVYPKLVVCLYEDIKEYIYNGEIIGSEGKLEKLLEWCEKAFELLRENVSLLYMTEILEIRRDVLKYIDMSDDEDKLIAETEKYIKVLKELYSEYGVSPYMTNDAYLYRESGNFCIGEVIYKRRKMKKMTVKELSEGICDVRTIRREENHISSMQRFYFEKVFDKLKLNPNYIDTGIVVETREQVELYYKLCLAENEFNYNETERLLDELRNDLPQHPINKQIIARIDSVISYSKGKIVDEEHIENLKKAMSYTVDIDNIGNDADMFFMTLDEMLIVYLISDVYKRRENYNEAYSNIELLWRWCKILERDELESSRMGIYEMIMSYMSSLLGDMKQYEESNNISNKLIKMGLVYKNSRPLHRCLYDQAWNNNQRKLEGFDYCKALNRCIHLSQLTGDVNDELFYKEDLVSCSVG